MNYYETLYIVHPSPEAGRLRDIILGVEESLKKLGGNSLGMEFWGKRKLAYFIDKQKYGTYVLIHFNGEGKCTGEFAVELEHNPNILAYLTTSIEKENVMEQVEDLDVQIAGKSREVARRESQPEKTEKTEETESDIGKAVILEGDSIETSTDEMTLEGGDKKLESETETKEVDTAEDNNEEETAENESDEENTVDDEASPEDETESKQENVDETAAVSEEE